MSMLRQIACTKCEGTGHTLDYFHPPYPEHIRSLYVLDVSHSGRRIYRDRTCEKCNGEGIAYIITGQRASKLEGQSDD